MPVVALSSYGTLPPVWQQALFPSRGQEARKPRIRRGTQRQRAKKVFHLHPKGTALPQKRHPGRKCISRGLGRNIR